MGALQRGRRGAFAVVLAGGVALALIPALACGASPAPAGSTGSARLWVRTYSGPGARDDVADSVAVAPNGSAVFVTGRSPSATGIVDYATVSYNASTGAQLWASRYAGVGGAGGGAVAVAVDPAGRAVFVTGSSPGQGTGTDYVTIAYNAATGQRLWLSRYNGPASGSDDPSAMAVSPDGRDVFVTGTSQGGPASGSDFATVGYDAATGARLWVSRFSGHGSADDVATALAVSLDGGTVSVTGGSGPDYATVAYDAVTGEQRWASLGPSGRASAIGVSGHQVFVTGTSENAFGTVAYIAGNGIRRWLSRYNGAGRAGSRANSLVVWGANLYITGAAGRDFATVRYGTGGGFQRWASISHVPGGSDSGARQVVLGRLKQRLYITGGAGDDIATACYMAFNGSRRWFRTFPGAGTSLAVNPVSGDVIVTGTSGRSVSGGNFTTIAYRG